MLVPLIRCLSLLVGEELPMNVPFVYELDRGRLNFELFNWAIPETGWGNKTAREAHPKALLVALAA